MENQISDKQWSKVEDILPGKKQDCGVTAKDNRKFVEAVLRVARTGAHWRAMPEKFGNWYTVYTRYFRWCNKGVREKFFRVLRGLGGHPKPAIGGHLKTGQ
jgi:transposase